MPLRPLTRSELDALAAAASGVGVPALWLGGLIEAESGWEPQAKNPRSSAVGLLQWTDDRARDIGFRDAAELAARNPDRVSQLRLAAATFRPHLPFWQLADLAASLFLPAWRGRPLDELFPDWVRAQNPRIRTMRDYLARIESAIRRFAGLYPETAPPPAAPAPGPVAPWAPSPVPSAALVGDWGMADAVVGLLLAVGLFLVFQSATE